MQGQTYNLKNGKAMLFEERSASYPRECPYHCTLDIQICISNKSHGLAHTSICKPHYAMLGDEDGPSHAGLELDRQPAWKQMSKACGKLCLLQAMLSPHTEPYSIATIPCDCRMLGAWLLARRLRQKPSLPTKTFVDSIGPLPHALGPSN